VIGARRAAAALERGALDSRITRAVADVLAPAFARTIVRPARVPAHLRLVCVGGATLGGSGKSRLANACARVLEGSILISHGYRARDRRARFVHPEETVVSAGDEALVAARAGLRVVIGPSRQAAIDFAAKYAEIVVLDGPLAVTKPPPKRVSLLAVNADKPWGSGQLFPAGDLRAPRSTLLALADHVMQIPTDIDIELPVRPFGLFTALARPERLINALHPDVVVSAPDHGPADPRELRREVTTWLATEKCALHLQHLKLPYTILPDTYMARLDHAFLRRILSSIDCERTGREDTRNHHRPEAGW
jgi:tetraacyldisaccharide 4'-kinase